MEYFNYTGGQYFTLLHQEAIFPVFRVELLDYAENVIGEITDEIIAESFSLGINYQSGVRRSCSFAIADTEGKYIPEANTGMFWIASKFKLYAGLKDPRSDDIYWFSQGVFFVNNPAVINSVGEKSVTINGVDKFGVFGSDLGFNQLEGTYVINAETNAHQAMRSILKLDFGNGYIIDPIAPIFDVLTADVELPYDINKAPQNYMSDILIEVADVIASDIFYNEDGHMVVSSGTTDISYASKASIYDFTDVLPEYIESSLTYDYNRAINVVKVVGTNITDESGIIEATATNNSPQSPTRVGLIPTKIKYVENTNISTLTQAEDLAKYILQKESIVPLAMDFSCSFIPHLHEDSVVTISDKYYGYEQQRFIIQEIDMTSTTMSVKATNIASLPYYEHQSA